MCAEKNRITIFQEGGLQALNTLVNSENDEVIAQTCEALSLLSRDSRSFLSSVFFFC